MYSPNIKDPRVLKRIKHAYGYARGVFSETKHQQKSQEAITKRFGRANDNLGKWLRLNLLTCVDHHFSEAAGISKSYILNATGAAEVRSLLLGNADSMFTSSEVKQIRMHKEPNKQFDAFVVKKFVEESYGHELRALEFTYEDKSNRLWHPIQQVTKDIKKEILAEHGLRYHYDIRCCAPTLIHQHAQHLGMDEYLFGINSYLKDRTAFRNDITEQAELYEEHGYADKTSKTFINALFCGARLGNSEHFALAGLLKYDSSRIEFLKQYNPITQLRDDIKVCWDAIKPTMSRRSVIDKNGNKKMLPISSKQKWLRYFELERQVLNAARDYFKKTGNRVFLEHDGWATELMIDVQDMKTYIKNKTGFDIEVDYEYICENMQENSNGVSAAHSQPAVVSSSTLVNSLRGSDTTELAIAEETSSDEHYKDRLALTYPMFTTSPVLPLNSHAETRKCTWIRQYIKRKQR